MPLLCIVGVLAVIVISLFFYLLNTGRKRNTPVNPAAGKKDYTPVYVTIADKPDSIMKGMDNFISQFRKTETAGNKWRWIPMIIFVAGVGLMMIDGLLLVFGYFSFVFTTGGILLWLSAFIMARSLRRSDTKDFSPRYKGTKEIIRTLRDDLKPGTTFLGHLDLTGSMLQTKVARETKDTQNRTTQYFSDQWLSLKAKLYDGNILRVAATQKSKKRKSYTKRSRISGKYKTKPEKFKGAEQELKIRIVVNPEAYKIIPNPKFRQGQNIGKYKIDILNTEDGMINIAASSPFEEVEQEHILSFVKSAYSLLERKAA